MKTYLAFAKFFALTLTLGGATACSALQSSAVALDGASSLNSNITVLQAAQSLTDGIFAKEAPLVAAAVKNLPETSQVMLQAAFATLQKGLDEAEQMAWSELSAADQAVAQSALHLLLNVRDRLHSTLHDSTVAVPPTIPLQDPNGLPVALPVPVADPNASVAVDPNTLTLVTSPNQLLAIDPCVQIIGTPSVAPTAASPLLIAP